MTSGEESPGTSEQVEGNDKIVWQLKLYISGQMPKSVDALTNINKICQEHLAGRYGLEVIDLSKNPELAKGEKIVALPTLVRSVPVPVKRIVGDLSNTEQVLVFLDMLPV